MLEVADRVPGSLTTSTDDDRALANRIYLVALALLVIIGAWLRLRLAIDRPLWDDELWHRFTVTRASWLDILLWRYQDPVHPAGSYIASRLAWDLMRSDAVWVWRTPSLIFGVASIPLAYLLGRRIATPGLGLGIAALVAIDLNLVWESANARMYPMLAFGTLLFLYCAMPVLCRQQTSVRHAIPLGLALTLLMWTQILGLVPWAALAIVGALLVVMHGRTPPSRREWMPVLINCSIAVALALVLSLPSVVNLLGVHNSEAGINRNVPLSELARVIYWVVGLLVWIEIRFVTPLILVLSVVGSALVARRSFALAALLLALGVVTTLLQMRVLQSHTFTAMRYWVTFQPILWVGLAYVCLQVPPPRYRYFGGIALSVFVATQFFHCLRLQGSYGRTTIGVEESRAFDRAVKSVLGQRSTRDAVTYVPFKRFAYRGEYFGLPASAVIGGEAHPASRGRQPLDRRAAYAPQATWVIVKMDNHAVSANTATELDGVLADLAHAYKISIDFKPKPAGDNDAHWLVLKVDKSGVNSTVFPVK